MGQREVFALRNRLYSIAQNGTVSAVEEYEVPEHIHVNPLWMDDADENLWEDDFHAGDYAQGTIPQCLSAIMSETEDNFLAAIVLRLAV